MSQSVITSAFEQLKAQEAANGGVVILDEFVFASVPDLNITDPIDRGEGMPDAAQVVHRQAVGKTGMVNGNAVVYSVNMGADVGDFEFNWVGLVNKASGVVAMIVHAPSQKKIKTAAGQQGNVLTRSFLMEYDGASEQTQIIVPADTWQIDFTARLNGVDERARIENRDIYGAASFFGDGFEVSKNGTQYSVARGVGYVAGLRAELLFNQALTVNQLPATVWADVSWKGTLTSVWGASVKLAVADSLADYVEGDEQHHVCMLALINADGTITDLRPAGMQGGSGIIDVLNDKQPLNDHLTGLSTLVPAGESLPYFSSGGKMSLAQLTAFARLLFSNNDAAGFVSGLGLQCADIAALRTTEPAHSGQRIDVICHTVRETKAAYHLKSAGEFQADLADNTTPDDGWLCVVTAGGKRWKRVVEDTLLNLAWAGVRPGDDITEPLKKAVEYLKASYIGEAAPASAAVISINAGEYKLSSIVEVPTFIRVISLGSANLKTPEINSGRIFDVFNDSSVPRPGFSGPVDQHPTFSGVGGCLTITGSGKLNNSATAFTFGNKVAGNEPCRGVGLDNVIVKYCGTGLSIRTKDTYLLSFSNSRLEQNHNNLYFGDATNVNSGESIKFSNMVFAATSGDNIIVNSPALELVFDKCQADYCTGTVINIGTQCNYSSLKFSNFRCEEFQGDFLKATPDALGNVSVFFTNLTVLPRNSGNKAVGNSPSRPLFNNASGCAIHVNGLEVLTEMRPYNENLSLSAEAGGSLSVSGFIRAPYRAMPSKNYILNRGHDFSDETTGATVSGSASALKRFTPDTISNITGTVIELDGGKALQLTGASTASYIRLYGAEYIPVQPGNMIGGCAAVQALGATGVRQAGFTVSWYDKDLNLINTPAQSTYKFNEAYADNTLPNYSEGTSRKMSTPAFSRTAPAGAVYARPRWEFSAISGVMNVINMTAFKIL